jgi:hypothetical protein
MQRHISITCFAILALVSSFDYKAALFLDKCTCDPADMLWRKSYHELDYLVSVMIVMTRIEYLSHNG